MLPRSTCIAVLLALVLVIDRSESFTSSFLPPISRRPTQRYASSTSLQMAIDKLDPSETALVLIEYQNEFTTEGGALYDEVGARGVMLLAAILLVGTLVVFRGSVRARAVAAE